MDEVSGVDTDKRLVRLKQHSISYDYLVLATGIQYNYFGHDEWRRVAPGLESLDDADLIRGKILLAFERAEEMAALDHADTEGIRQLLTFVLVGAGTVGVEMASTLAEMSRMALAHDFRHIDPRDAQILLYEAAPLALVAEAAGGRASTGRARILDVPATDYHQRTPIFIGSAEEIGWVEQAYREGAG